MEQKKANDFPGVFLLGLGLIEQKEYWLEK